MIKIRSLKRNADFDDLIALSREFFQEYGAYHKNFFNITKIKDEQVISYFSSFCGDHSRKAFIAVDAGRTVGYITVYLNERAEYWKITKVGDISGLMVKKEYRRIGIAEKLLEEAKLFLGTNLIITRYSLPSPTREPLTFTEKMAWLRCILH